MDIDMGENTPKTVLRPKNPGERLKVARTVLNRRDRNIAAAAERAKKIQDARKKEREYMKGSVQLIRLETMVKHSMNWLKDKKRLHVHSVNQKKYKAIAHNKVVLVGRNGRGGGSTETKALLRELRCKSKHSLVFLPNTVEIISKLNRVKPFVYWGVCSFKLMFNLIHKKARFRNPEDVSVNTMLNDNTVIEEHLGKYGILCTEDLAHMIYTRGPHFDEVVERLWPMYIGDQKKASGMVHEERYVYGLQDGMEKMVTRLIGE